MFVFCHCSFFFFWLSKFESISFKAVLHQLWSILDGKSVMFFYY